MMASVLAWSPDSVWLLLQKTWWFLVVLGILVAFHELGHFLAARWVGVKVLKFSLGFGPKLLGRQGIITFESNGLFVVVRGAGFPRVRFPGFRDIRGYQAMYRDFHRSIHEGRSPAMSLESAMEDQRLMDRIYRSLTGSGPLAVVR